MAANSNIDHMEQMQENEDERFFRYRNQKELIIFLKKFFFPKVKVKT